MKQNEMTLNKLKRKLSNLGSIEVCKEGYVFTLLITGENINDWKISSEIQTHVLEYAKGKYPVIECMKSNSEFLLIVLKPNDSKQSEEKITIKIV